MNVKKILGVLLGLIVGSIPYVNALTSGAVAFARKNIKLGILILVSFIMQVAMVIMIGRDDSRRHNEDGTFAENIERGILQLKTSSAEQYNFVQFTDSLSAIVKREAQQRAATTTFPLKVYESILQDKLSKKQRTNYDDFIKVVYEVYHSQNTAADNKKEQFPFAGISYDAHKKLTTGVQDFALMYITNEARELGGIAEKMGEILLVVSYLLSLIVTVFVFKDIFVSKNNTTDKQPRQPIETKTTVHTVTPDMPAYTDDVFEPVNNTEKKKEPGVSVPDNVESSGEEKIVPVKINEATEEELAQLPGISSIQAANIIKEREANGSYSNMDNFKSRIALSERVYKNLADALDFSAPEEIAKPKGRVVDF